MTRYLMLTMALSVMAMAQTPSLVGSVRRLLAQNDAAGAERAVREWQAHNPASPEAAAALSWLARGALQAHKLEQAEGFAEEAFQVASRFLGGRKIDDDRWLPTALGASVEVKAQAMAARGERAEAVAYLQARLGQFAGTTLVERIRKNINLLSLEGKPAPALELAGGEWLGTKPAALAALRGHPVLLFFWAHWCPDCKAQVNAIAQVQRASSAQGLVVVAPTRLYGYVAGGEDAPAAKEKSYIEEVRRRFYGAMGDVAVPMAAANFTAYGASTTPTLVLVDRAGIVRMYHPGAMAEGELAAAIRGLR